MSTEIPGTEALLKTTVQATDDGAMLVITDSAVLREVLGHPAVTLFGSDVAETQLDALPRVALAVVDGAADFPSQTAAAQIVGRLRDVQANRVLVIAGRDDHSPLGRQALIGLGFHRWASSQDADGRRRWYEFDMAHYKVTPDWLNPRNWANPALWDKYRW